MLCTQYPAGSIRCSLQTTTEEVKSHEEGQSDVIANNISADSNDDVDNNSDLENKQSLSVVEYDDVVAELSDEYQQLMNKAKAVVKIFKGCQLKMTRVLQKYIIVEQGHGIHLALNCKTQWNRL